MFEIKIFQEIGLFYSVYYFNGRLLLRGKPFASTQDHSKSDTLIRWYRDAFVMDQMDDGYRSSAGDNLAKHFGLDEAISEYWNIPRDQSHYESLDKLRMQVESSALDLLYEQHQLFIVEKL